MELLPHTLDWIHGEIFESTCTAVFGGLLLVIALVCYFVGQSPGAKALVIPLLVVALLFIGSGLGGRVSNQGRIEAYTEQHDRDPGAFARAEKQRVEGFAPIYRGTIIGAAICFTLALGVFCLTPGITWRSIAIAIMMIGITGIVIDYFSKERADIYYEKILRSMN